MREYAKLSPRIYTGTLGAAMRGDPFMQALAAYLIASPHSHMSGLYRLPIAYAASDLGWPANKVEGALKGLQEAGFVRFDPDNERVWVVEMARHELGGAKAANLSDKDNRLKGLRRGLFEHAVSPLALEFAAYYCLEMPEPEPGQNVDQEDCETRGFEGATQAPSHSGAGTGDGAGTGEGDTSAGKPPTESPLSRVARFMLWWEAFPRKVGKRRARASWARLDKAGELPPLSEMLATLSSQRASEQWRDDGGKYIPHPTTYLNRGSWADEDGKPGSRSADIFDLDRRLADGRAELAKLDKVAS